jgi:TDG/mug DNA glycosylase family protein
LDGGPDPARGAALRDRVAPGIDALFVGINPGARSAAIGHHFAGFSNRFWKLLFDAGLVPEPLRAEDDWRLPSFGYGITNLVARATPGISDLNAAEYEAGRRRLVATIRRYRPRLVVLVGVTLYRALFPEDGGLAPGSHRRQTRAEQLPPGDLPALPQPLGLPGATLGGVPVFVVPNPSGRNANYSYGEMLGAFVAVKQYLERP